MESMAWKGKGRAQGEPWAQEAFCKEESFDPLAEFQERGYYLTTQALGRNAAR